MVAAVAGDREVTTLKEIYADEPGESGNGDKEDLGSEGLSNDELDAMLVASMPDDDEAYRSSSEDGVNEDADNENPKLPFMTYPIACGHESYIICAGSILSDSKNMLMNLI